MKKRKTITIDEALEKKLRMRQATIIKNSHKGISFSATLNDILRDCLKKRA